MKGVVAIVVLAGAAALGATSPHATPAGCGKSAAGPGFRVFACMSGGSAGHLHPKELLVVRNDGASVAYPAFRVGQFAAGAGEVVATYDVGLVRVTSRRLISLVTSRELARSLHVRPAAIMGLHDPRIDARGDLYFVASVLRGNGGGCRNPLLERVAGTIRQLRATTTHSSICS